MKISHFSINSTLYNHDSSIKNLGGPYCIIAELNFCPLSIWKDSFLLVWNNSQGNLNRDVSIYGSEIRLIVNNSTDIQYYIEKLSKTIEQTENLLKSVARKSVSLTAELVNNGSLA